MLTLVFPHSRQENASQVFFFLNDMFLVPATQISLCVGSGMLSTVGNVVLQPLAQLQPHGNCNREDGGTLVVTVTWCCHLVLHASAWIPRRSLRFDKLGLQVGTSEKNVDWITVATSSFEEDGTPLKTARASQLSTISGWPTVENFVRFLRWTLDE